MTVDPMPATGGSAAVAHTLTHPGLRVDPSRAEYRERPMVLYATGLTDAYLRVLERICELPRNSLGEPRLELALGIGRSIPMHRLGEVLRYLRDCGVEHSVDVSRKWVHP